MSTKAAVFHKKQPRMPNEKYYTPAWVTNLLVDNFNLHGRMIWEPAAGGGHICGALHRRGIGPLYASDVAPEHPEIRHLNFLVKGVAAPPEPFNIVTNPPFGHQGALAVRFIKRALELAEPHGGAVAMLLRDDFDSAGGRTAIFRDCPAFVGKLVILKRIRWVNLPQAKAGPSGSHAWFLWDTKWKFQAPMLRYVGGK